MRWLATVLVAGCTLLAVSAAAQPPEDDQTPPTEDQAGLDGADGQLDEAQAAETPSNLACANLRFNLRDVPSVWVAPNAVPRGFPEGVDRMRLALLRCPLRYRVPWTDEERRAAELRGRAVEGELDSADQGTGDQDSGDRGTDEQNSGDQATEDPGR